MCWTTKRTYYTSGMKNAIIDSFESRKGTIAQWQSEHGISVPMVYRWREERRLCRIEQNKAKVRELRSSIREMQDHINEVYRRISRLERGLE